MLSFEPIKYWINLWSTRGHSNVRTVKMGVTKFSTNKEYISLKMPVKYKIAYSVSELSDQQSLKRLIFVTLLVSTVVVLVLVNKLSVDLEAHETLPTIKILNVEHYSHETSSVFLSIALDASLIRSGWIHDNIKPFLMFSSEKLLHLTSLLAPAYLRVGGTLSDCLIFNANATQKETDVREAYHAKDKCVHGLHCFPEVRNFTMTGSEWIQLNNFSQKAGLELLFDLNVLLRDGDEWDSTNARELLNFTEYHNFSVSWQLGNEPNAFRHVFNMSVSAQQLAKDFLSLRGLLNMYPSFHKSLLVGPDVTRPLGFSYPSLQFLEEFLDSVDDAISAVTWHHYYVDGRSATLEDFTNTSVLNYLAEQIDAVKGAVRKKNATIPIWLTETSTAYGGGAPGLSDVFVAGFLWLDKLGLSARLGIDVVIRQDLYGSSYSLLNLETMDPNPDWWLSIMYKSLVGQGVLKTAIPSGGIRLYCHCAPPHILLSSQGAVTVFGVNISPDKVQVQLEGLLQSQPTNYVLAYILTGEYGLLSKSVLLNHKHLQLDPDGSLPPFQPVVLPSTHIYMPPLSMAFFVIHDIHVPGCYGT